MLTLILSRIPANKAKLYLSTTDFDTIAKIAGRGRLLELLNKDRDGSEIGRGDPGGEGYSGEGLDGDDDDDDDDDGGGGQDSPGQHAGRGSDDEVGATEAEGREFGGRSSDSGFGEEGANGQEHNGRDFEDGFGGGGFDGRESPCRNFEDGFGAAQADGQKHNGRDFESGFGGGDLDGRESPSRDFEDGFSEGDADGRDPLDRSLEDRVPRVANNESGYGGRGSDDELSREGHSGSAKQSWDNSDSTMDFYPNMIPLGIIT